MDTRVDEIADDIFRLSTLIPGANIMMNQVLERADEPLLFHSGYRSTFPLVSEAIGRILPVESLRWITFGHVEADECGAMNQLLAAAPDATVAHGAMAVVGPVKPPAPEIQDEPDAPANRPVPPA